jgi:hypothetical protein
MCVASAAAAGDDEWSDFKRVDQKVAAIEPLHPPAYDRKGTVNLVGTTGELREVMRCLSAAIAAGRRQVSGRHRPSL